MFLLKGFREYLKALKAEAVPIVANEAKLHKTNNKYNGTEILVYENPNYEYLISALKDKNFRFIVSKSDLYVWSAYDATHEEVLNSSLGLDKILKTDYQSDYPSEAFGMFRLEDGKIRVSMYQTNDYRNFLNCSYVKILLKRGKSNFLVYVKDDPLAREGDWIPVAA